MQLSRLPVSIIVGLGLVAGAEVSCAPCLKYASSESESEATTAGASASTTTAATSSSASSSAGTGGTGDATMTPCLKYDLPPEVTTGPCLGQLPTGTGDATGTGTDSDSDSDSDGTGTRGGETTTGPCLVPPLEGDATAEPDRATRAAAPKRPARAVIERVLSASALPDDVVARLRQRLTASTE